MKNNQKADDHSTKKIVQLVERMKGSVRLTSGRTENVNIAEEQNLARERKPFLQVKSSLLKWLDKTRALSLKLPFVDSENNNIGSWSEFVPPELITSVRQANNHTELRDAIMANALDAHQLMLLSFLDQVQNLETQMGQFEPRYFDDYIERVVKQKPLSTIPEKAHVVVEAGEEKEMIIPQHQKFIGKNQQGETLTYKTLDDSFINDCHLQNIDIVAKQVDGIQGAFQKTYNPTDISSPRFELPVNFNDIQWEDGVGELVIQSPALNLPSGKREIRLTFINQGEPISNETLSTIQEILSVSVANEGEWVLIDYLVEEENEGLTCWNVNDKSIQLSLAEGDLACEGKIALAVNYQAVNEIANDTRENVLSSLSAFLFDQVRLVVNVDQYALATAKNQNGSYTLDGPFFPFVSPIRKRSAFEIDLGELSPIGLKSISAGVTWNNLPELGLKDYYQVYSNYHNRKGRINDPDNFNPSEIDESSFSADWSLNWGTSRTHQQSLGEGSVALFENGSDSIDWNIMTQMDSGKLEEKHHHKTPTLTLLLKLSEHSHFQHAYYTRIQQAEIQNKSVSSSGLLIGDPAEDNTEQTLNPPFEPEIASIDLSFSSEIILNVLANNPDPGSRTPGKKKDNGFYFSMPDSTQALTEIAGSDIETEDAPTAAIGIKPALNQDAYLSLAFDQLSLGNCLNIYFNLHRPGVDCSNTQSTVENPWSLWTNNGWETVKVLNDETENLAASGVINFWLPSHAEKKDGVYRLVYCGTRQQLAGRIQSILVNSVTLALTTEQHRNYRWQEPLPEESITEAENNEAITTVFQPYPGFSGRSAETPSENHHHFGLNTQYKSRFNKPMSYDKQLLHRFNELLMVKCLPESASTTPGEIKILVLPKSVHEVDPAELETGNNLSLPGYLVQDIQDFLAPYLPLGVKAAIETPSIKKRCYSISLLRDVESAENFEFYSDLIREKLKEMLNPYSQFYRENIGFSPYVPNSLIRRELENLLYVERVSGLAVWKTDQDQKMHPGEKLKNLYTFDERSEICWVNTKGEYIAGDTLTLDHAITTRIGESIIEENFIVG